MMHIRMYVCAVIISHWAISNSMVVRDFGNVCMYIKLHSSMHLSLTPQTSSVRVDVVVGWHVLSAVYMSVCIREDV